MALLLLMARRENIIGIRLLWFLCKALSLVRPQEPLTLRKGDEIIWQQSCGKFVGMMRLLLHTAFLQRDRPLTLHVEDAGRSSSMTSVSARKIRDAIWLHAMACSDGFEVVVVSYRMKARYISALVEVRHRALSGLLPLINVDEEHHISIFQGKGAGALTLNSLPVPPYRVVVQQRRRPMPFQTSLYVRFPEEVFFELKSIEFAFSDLEWHSY